MGEKKKDRSSVCYWSFKTAVECFKLFFLYFLKPAVRTLGIGYQEVSLMSSNCMSLFQKSKKFLLKIKTDRINKNT
jgi:hypothetical protein